MSRQFSVWIKCTKATPECYRDDIPLDTWTPNGDGPMGPKTSERVAREIEENCPGVKAQSLRVGQIPN